MSCRAGRDVAVIEHPPGVETQFDWVELPDPPSSWRGGRQAHLLVGALSHSGRWRGVLAECYPTWILRMVASFVVRMVWV
jgi:hypothetical protein